MSDNRAAWRQGDGGPLRALVIDPGVADMGVLWIEHGRVVRAETWKTEADGPRPSWEGVLARCHTQVARLEGAALEWRPGVIVCEGYEDFGGQHKRGVKHRWTTPVLLGMIAASFGTIVRWQPAGDVLRAYSVAKAMWAQGTRGLIPGDNLITNDHLRSAGCHALWYLTRAVRP